MLISRMEFIKQNSKRKVALLNLTIDNIIQIREIKVIKNREELIFVYPVVKDRHGRELNLIKFKEKNVEIKTKQLLILAYEKFLIQDCNHGIFLLKFPQNNIYQLEMHDFVFFSGSNVERERLNKQVYNTGGFTSILIYRMAGNSYSNIRAIISFTWDDTIQFSNILLKQIICGTGKRLSVIWPGENKQGIQYQSVVPTVDFVNIVQLFKEFYREKQYEEEVGWIWIKKEEIFECTYLIEDYISFPYISKKRIKETKSIELKEEVFQLLAPYLKCEIPVHLSALRKMFEEAGINFQGNYRTLIAQDSRYEIVEKDFVQISENSKKLLDEITVPEEFMKKNKKKNKVEDVSYKISDTDRKILLALYEKGCYKEFLKHNIFQQNTPDKLGSDLLECAVNCARMCLDNNSEKITFNEFQKVLVNEKKASDLYKYKTLDILNLGLNTCQENCDGNQFKKYFNEVLRQNTLNNNYKGIVERFVACHNIIAIYFYVLWIYHNKNVSYIVGTIFNHYIENNRFYEPEGRFTDLLYEASEIVSFSDAEWNSSFSIKLLGKCLEYNQMDNYQIYSRLLGYPITSSFYKVVDKINQCVVSDVNSIKDLLQLFSNTEIMIRLIGLLWYRRYDLFMPLTIEVIDLLSYFVYIMDNTNLDNLICMENDFGFTKDIKMKLLHDSFLQIVKRIAENHYAFTLAEYVYGNILDEEFDSSMITMWKVERRKYIKEISISEVSAGSDVFYRNWAEASKLLQCSVELLGVERYYAQKDVQYFLGQENWENAINNLINMTITGVRNYTIILLVQQIGFEKIIQYVDRKQFVNRLKAVYIKYDMYREAIELIKSEKNFGWEDQYLEMLNRNFLKFGLDMCAYNVFSSVVDMEEAEELIYQSIVEKKKLKFIVPYIGIFAYKNEMIKCGLLLFMHKSISNFGFNNFHRCVEKRLGYSQDIQSVCSAIRMAIQYLNLDQIFEFILWVRTFPENIAFKKSKIFNIYDEELLMILKDPYEPQKWGALLGKLNRFIKPALFYSVICICINMFPDNFDDEEERCISILRTNEPELLSLNVLTLNCSLMRARKMSINYWSVFEQYYLKNCQFKNLLYRKSVWGLSEMEIEYPVREMAKSFCNAVIKRYMEEKSLEYLNCAIACWNAMEQYDMVNIEEVKLICKSNASKEGILTLIINMINNGYIMKASELLGTKWGEMSRKEEAIYRMLITGEDDEGEEFFAGQTRYSYVQECCKILREYPYKLDMDYWYSMLTNKDTLNNGIAVARFLQKIYDVSKIYNVVIEDSKLNIWENIGSERGILCAYLQDSIKIKLERIDAGEQYVIRKYQKYFLCRILNESFSSGNLDGILFEIRSDMLKLMSENQHYSLYYEKFVDSFYINIIDFFKKREYFIEDTKHMLYCLITDQWDSYFSLFRKKKDIILDESFKYMIHHMDYREFIITCIRTWMEAQEEKQKQEIKAIILHIFPMADSFMNYYENLEVGRIRDSLNKFFNKANNKRSIKSTMDMIVKFVRVDVFEEIFLPLLVMSFYPRQIIYFAGSMIGKSQHKYDIIINNNKLYKILDEYIKVSELNAGECFLYLCLLQQAISGNKEECKNYIQKLGEIPRIPVEWSDEYDKLKAFAFNDIDEFFIPVIFNRKNNEIEKENITVSFFEEPEIVNDEPINLLEVFKNEYFDYNSRINSLAQYIKQNEIGKSGYSHNRLLFEYGLLKISCHNITIRDYDKFKILVELAGFWDRLNEKNKEELAIRIIQELERLSQNLALIEWSKCLDKFYIIFLRRQMKLDEYNAFFKDARRIIQIYQSEIATMEQLDEYKDFTRKDSSEKIAINFRNSVKKEISKIENSTVLEASIQNEYLTVEQPYIFISIKNVGRKTIEIGSLFINVSCKHENINLMIERRTQSYFSGRLHPGEILAETYELKDTIEENEKVSVFLDVKKGETLIVRRNLQNLQVRRMGKGMWIFPEVPRQYDTSQEAFSRDVDGFGREEECQKIKQRLQNSRWFLIYGSSRVGKTSLLRYIENKLIHDKEMLEGINKKEIICVYCRQYTDSSLLKALFIHSVLNGLQQYDGKVSNGRLNEMMDKLKEKYKLIDDSSSYITEMIEICKTCIDSNNVCDRDIMEVLQLFSAICKQNKSELWFVFDEFQEVVSNYEGDVQGINGLIDILKNHNDVYENIKMIFCGSDKLVTEIECGINLVWSDLLNKILYPSRIIVRNFSQDEYGKDKSDFFRLYTEKKYLGEYTKFSQEAINYLWNITKGNVCMSNNIVYRLLEHRKAGIKYLYYPAHIYPIAREIVTEIKEGRNVFANIFCRDLSRIEQKCAKVIAYLMDIDQKAYKDVIIQEVNERKGDIENALNVLVSRAIIDNVHNLDTEYYYLSNDIYFNYFRKLYDSTELKNDFIDKKDKQEEKNMSMNVFNINKVNGLSTGSGDNLFDDAQKKIYNGYSAKDVSELMKNMNYITQEQIDQIMETLKEWKMETNSEELNSIYSELENINKSQNSWLSKFKMMLGIGSGTMGIAINLPKLLDVAPFYAQRISDILNR